MKKAGPILLEPMMKVEVSTPDEFQGDIIGDLSRRRGKIMNTESKNKTTNVHAEVPLSEMFGYVNNIRSMSKGRAAYTMEPSHFEQVPLRHRRADHRTEEGQIILWPKPASAFASRRLITACSTAPQPRSPRRRPAPAPSSPAPSRFRPGSSAIRSTARPTSTRRAWTSSKCAPTSACSTSSSPRPRRWTSSRSSTCPAGVDIKIKV